MTDLLEMLKHPALVALGSVLVIGWATIALTTIPKAFIKPRMPDHEQRTAVLRTIALGWGALLGLLPFWPTGLSEAVGVEPFWIGELQGLVGGFLGAFQEKWLSRLGERVKSRVDKLIGERKTKQEPGE